MNLVIVFFGEAVILAVTVILFGFAKIGEWGLFALLALCYVVWVVLCMVFPAGWWKIFMYNWQKNRGSRGFLVIYSLLSLLFAILLWNYFWAAATRRESTQNGS